MNLVEDQCEILQSKMPNTRKRVMQQTETKMNVETYLRK